jgi:hypothetical protein
LISVHDDAWFLVPDVLVVLINTSVLISDQRVGPAYEANDERETYTVERHTRSKSSATTTREVGALREQAAMNE